MKIQINREVLSSSLKTISKISKNCDIKIVAKNEQVKIVAKNEDLQHKFYIYSCSVETEGEVFVKFDSIANIIELFNDTTIILENNCDNLIKIKDITIKQIKRFEEKEIFKNCDLLCCIKEKDLKRVINKTKKFISKDNTKLPLKCIYFNKNYSYLDVVGIDGYKMSICKIKDIELENFSSFLLLGENLIALEKILDKKSDNLIKVLKKEDYITLNINNMYINFKDLIKKEFVDYKKLINDYKNYESCVVIENTQKMKKTLKILQKHKSLDRNNLIKLSVKEDKIVLSKETENHSINLDVEILEFEGKTLEIYFNNDYLLNVFENTTGECMMTFNGETNPINVTEKDDETLFLLLPVRVNQRR